MAKITIIKLDHPIDITLTKSGGKREETITQINLRRPKVKDLKGLNLAHLEGADMITLVSRLSGLDSAVFDEVDAADFLNMSEMVAGFFPKPLVKKKKA